MACEHVAYILDNSKAKGAARLVLAALCLEVDDMNLAPAGSERLARRAGVSASTAKSALAQLCKLGEIALAELGGGRGKPSIYRLSILAKGAEKTPCFSEKGSDDTGVSGEKGPKKPPVLSEPRACVESTTSPSETTSPPEKVKRKDKSFLSAGARESGSNVFDLSIPMKPPKCPAAIDRLEPFADDIIEAYARWHDLPLGHDLDRGENNRTLARIFPIIAADVNRAGALAVVNAYRFVLELVASGKLRTTERQAMKGALDRQIARPDFVRRDLPKQERPMTDLQARIAAGTFTF